MLVVFDVCENFKWSKEREKIVIYDWRNDMGGTFSMDGFIFISFLYFDWIIFIYVLEVFASTFVYEWQVQWPTQSKIAFIYIDIETGSCI